MKKIQYKKMFESHLTFYEYKIRQNPGFADELTNVKGYKLLPDVCQKLFGVKSYTVPLQNSHLAWVMRKWLNENYPPPETEGEKWLSILKPPGATSPQAS